MSQKTADRILAMALEMGYNPVHSHAARRLVSTRTGYQVINHTIALYFPLPMAGIPYFSKLLRGIHDVLSEEHFAVITNLQEDNNPDSQLLPIFMRGDVDGAMSIIGSAILPTLLPKLRSVPGFSNRPIMLMLEAQPSCSAVLTDDRAGGYAIAQHLLQLGHRGILHFYYAGHPLYQQRLEGIEQAIRDYHLQPEDVLVARRWPIVDEGELLSIICGSAPPALRQYSEISAIIALHDQVAVELYYLLTRAGINIPQDVSLVGYDDTEIIIDANGNNLLTTVHVPLEEIGRTAARLLIDRITGKIANDETHVFTTDLIIRGSTAHAKMANPSFINNPTEA